MRSLLLMMFGMFMMPVVLLLAACEPTVYDVSHYKNDPDKRRVTIDGQTLYVVPQIGGYAAWGSGSDKWAKYRQRRAIEILSHCRIDQVVSKPSDKVTYATVNC